MIDWDKLEKKFLDDTEKMNESSSFWYPMKRKIEKERKFQRKFDNMDLSKDKKSFINSLLVSILLLGLSVGLYFLLSSVTRVL